MLSSFDNNFSFGFEYEFWINSQYLNKNKNKYVTENFDNPMNSLINIFQNLNLDDDKKIEVDENKKDKKRIYKWN